MTTNEIQKFLTTVMRGIDKKTAITIEPIKQEDRLGVVVRMVRDQRTGSVQINESDLLAAQSDLIQRERVRVAMKRARDRMWEVTGHFVSTKMERPKMEGFQRSFRPGGRR